VNKITEMFHVIARSGAFDAINCELGDVSIE
jgi:hypothetical protein